MRIWHDKWRAPVTGVILASLLGLLVLQCDTNRDRGIVMPSWYITLTIPLVSDFYGFDGIVKGDTTGTIGYYGTRLDTVNSVGDSVTLFLPDSDALYPGGLYIGLESDLPPITLPGDMFRIPGNEFPGLGVGPIPLGDALEGLDEGIQDSVESEIDIAALFTTGDSMRVDTIPAHTCFDDEAFRLDTTKLTFGNQPGDINELRDITIPGVVKTIDGSFWLPGDAGGCFDCDAGFSQPGFVCDSTVEISVEEHERILPFSTAAASDTFTIFPDISGQTAGTPMTGVESIVIESGQVITVVDNQTPLNARNVELVLYTEDSQGDTTHIHTHIRPFLPPYMYDSVEDITYEDSVVTDLAGAVFYENLYFDFQPVDVDGSEPTDTLLFPLGVEPAFNYSFRIEIDSFDTLKVFMADTTIGYLQEFNTTSGGGDDEQQFSVDIISATFQDNINHPDTNRLDIEVENNLGLNIDTLRISLLNFFNSEADTASGTYKTIELTDINDGDTESHSEVLDGNLIASLDGQPIDSLEIVTDVIFESQDGVVGLPFPLPDEMGMNVAVDLSILRIGQLEGMFDINFDITAQEQPLSMPGLIGGVTFGEAFLIVTLENQFGVEPGLGLQVAGYRDEDSVIVELDPDSVTFEPGDLGDTTITEIQISRDYVVKTVDESSSIVQTFIGKDNIVDLMGLLPDVVRVGGEAQINPEDRSFISAGATIQGSWRFEIPFLLQIQSGGVEFLPSSYTDMAALDSSTIENLVGSNMIPDASDALISSRINTLISSDIGVGFGMEILVSDIPYFPFYSSQENRALVSTTLDDDLDGLPDTTLNLDTLIRHPVVPTLELLIPSAEVDPNTGIAVPGLEGTGTYSYSADFNLTETTTDTLENGFVYAPFAFVDTFLITRKDSGIFASVEEALTFAEIAAPSDNIPDSLYVLELNEDGDELNLIYTVSPYGELGWMIDPVDHYIATKFIVYETANPALISADAGIDVTAWMEFVLNSEPMLSAEEDTTQ